MKKILSLTVLAVLLCASVFAFASCSKKDGDGGDDVAHTHTMGEWKIETAATCTANGKEVRKCTAEGCNHTEQKDIPALGHDLINHKGEEATCTDIGYDDYVTCSRCLYNTYVEIDAFGHSYKGGVCKNCDQSHIHSSYGEWYGNTATCTESGYEYRDCEGCDYVDSRETSMLPHDYDEGVCVDCGNPDSNGEGDNLEMPEHPLND